MEFLTAVCGFHYYKKYWDPVESECLDCADEKENPYHYFAIKKCQEDGKIVVIFHWKSLDQPNIYLTEEQESLRR